MKLPVEAVFLLIRNLRPRSESSAIFLSVVFSTIFACMLVYVVFYIKKWKSAKKWERIKIMPSELEFAIFDKKKIISFKYKFWDNIYTGRKISINSRHRFLGLHPKAKAFIERAISDNISIDIYVNQESPNMAYVDVEFDKSIIVTLALFILFALVWVFVIMTIDYV
jgi:hypothetical protein